MSEENLERIKAGFEAYNRGDLDAFLDEFWSAFEMVELETHDFRQTGSKVVVPNTAHMRGRDGIEVAAKSTFVFTVEHGLTTRLEMFQGRAEALEAVGLQE
jgi:hypothetical protein